MSAEQETLEYQSSELINGILRDWVRHAATVAGSGGDASDYEGYSRAIGHMRNLYLAEPWLVTKDIFDALKLSGWTPPEGYVFVDYSEKS